MLYVMQDYKVYDDYPIHYRKFPIEILYDKNPIE